MPRQVHPSKLHSTDDVVYWFFRSLQPGATVTFVHGTSRATYRRIVSTETLGDNGFEAVEGKIDALGSRPTLTLTALVVAADHRFRFDVSTERTS